MWENSLNTDVLCALSSSLKVITTCDNVVNGRAITLERKRISRRNFASVVSFVLEIFLVACGALSRSTTGRSGTKEFGYTVFYKITRHNRTGRLPKKVLLKAANRGRGYWGWSIRDDGNSLIPVPPR